MKYKVIVMPYKTDKSPFAPSDFNLLMYPLFRLQADHMFHFNKKIENIFSNFSLVCIVNMDVELCMYYTKIIVSALPCIDVLLMAQRFSVLLTNHQSRMLSCYCKSEPVNSKNDNNMHILVQF